MCPYFSDEKVRGELFFHQADFQAQQVRDGLHHKQKHLEDPQLQ